MRTIPLIMTAFVLVLHGAVAVRAQVPDHLKCQTVKDSLGKAQFAADLGGFVAETGCIVKLPAKLLCEAATKTNVDPPPPGGSSQNAAGRFLCYNVKCPKRDSQTAAFRDQFGSHAIVVGPTKLLCAPEAVPTCANLLEPCGTCGNGICFLHFLDAGAVEATCVDGPTCGGVACTEDAQCPSGQVCAGVIEARSCCVPCD